MLWTHGVKCVPCSALPRAGNLYTHFYSVLIDHHYWRYGIVNKIKNRKTRAMTHLKCRKQRTLPWPLPPAWKTGGKEGNQIRKGWLPITRQCTYDAELEEISRKAMALKTKTPNKIFSPNRLRRTLSLRSVGKFV